MNLGKKRKLHGFFKLTQSPSPQLVVALTATATTTGKTAAWQPLGGRAGLELLQSPIPRESALSDLSGGSLEDPTCKANLSNSSKNGNSIFPEGFCCKQSEAII